ncbi:cGMP-gated cation channel alpha-1 [Schistosoma japonicum]|nr:cGMP-gated cation channel alpha-1 [Schistosoma japonicum]KAH8872435.1 cGMP-gated cation channel alpha-1 [Schistosoma japonicum]
MTSEIDQFCESNILSNNDIPHDDLPEKSIPNSGTTLMDCNNTCHDDKILSSSKINNVNENTLNNFKGPSKQLLNIHSNFGMSISKFEKIARPSLAKLNKIYYGTHDESQKSSSNNNASRRWKKVQCTMKVVLSSMDHVKLKRKPNNYDLSRKDSFMSRFSTQRRGTSTTDDYLTDTTYDHSYMDQLYSQKKFDNYKYISDMNDNNDNHVDNEEISTNKYELNKNETIKSINIPEKQSLLDNSFNPIQQDVMFYLDTPNVSYNYPYQQKCNNDLIKCEKFEIHNEHEQTNAKILSNYKKSNIFIVFYPNSTGYVIWLTIVSLALLYNLWTPIARQAFDELQLKYHKIWLSLDILADIIYLIDIFVQCNTSYLKCGLKVQEHYKLIIRYIKSYKFLLDILSLLPLDLLQFKIGIQPMLRFPRFLKFYRCQEWKLRVENRTIFPNLWRVLTLIHILFLGCHWFAAFYYLISKYEGFKSPWGYQPYIDAEQVTMSRRYLKSFYWATLTLTTIGDLSSPTSSIELTFTIVSYLIGVFIFATIVGQVGNIITTRNAHRTEFEKILDNAKSYMRENSVSKDLQNRILRWYDYAWSKGSGRGGQDINSLGMLPDKLRTELALNVNLETLKKVTIFHECRPEFLHDIVLKMRPLVLTPGDLICRKGEIAREMFIIADGVLEVLSEENEVLSTMGPGDFFGEIGVLNLDGINRRTADVRAVGYAELFVLARDDILKALKDHPEAEFVIRKHAAKRLYESRHRRSGILQARKSPSCSSNFSSKFSPILQKHTNLFPAGNTIGCSVGRELSRFSTSPVTFDKFLSQRRITSFNVQSSDRLTNNSDKQHLITLMDTIEQFIVRWDNILTSLVDNHRKELLLLKENLIQSSMNSNEV